MHSSTTRGEGRERSLSDAIPGWAQFGAGEGREGGGGRDEYRDKIRQICLTYWVGCRRRGLTDAKRSTSEGDLLSLYKQRPLLLWQMVHFRQLPAWSSINHYIILHYNYSSLIIYVLLCQFSWILDTLSIPPDVQSIKICQRDWYIHLVKYQDFAEFSRIYLSLKLLYTRISTARWHWSWSLNFLLCVFSIFIFVWLPRISSLWNTWQPPRWHEDVWCWCQSLTKMGIL